MTDRAPASFDEVLAAAEPLAVAFADAGHRLFFVGGVVRDHWLGVDRDDFDLDATTDARPPEIKRLVGDLADSVWTQGERFGTIGCTIDGRIYEITTHRTEVYDEGSRKPDVAFGDDILDDLARRDFTVNAMAVDLATRELVDPFDGRGDLDRRALRTPLAPEVAFSEDPLRMLRAARFHAGYALEPATELRAAVAAMGDRMQIVSAERIRDELDKLLHLRDPIPGLRFLASTGLLRWIVPGLADLDDAAIEEVGRRLVALDDSTNMRWAALLLDLDDPDTTLRAMRSSRAHRTAVLELIAARRWLHGRVPEGRPAIRRAAAATREMSIDELVVFVRVVAAGGVAIEAIDGLARAVSALRMAEPDLDAPSALLNGAEVIELLGLGEGPDVGRAMDWLRELRFDEGVLPGDEAAARLRDWWPGPH